MYTKNVVDIRVWKFNRAADTTITTGRTNFKNGNRKKFISHTEFENEVRIKA